MLSKAIIKAKAESLGFSRVGFTNDLHSKNYQFHEWWIEQGFGADMHYLERQRERRSSIQKILPGAQTVIVCALRFSGKKESKDECKEQNGLVMGKVARYAQGEDYHFVMKRMLEELAKFIDKEGGIDENNRSLAYVDTGAISERALGAQAGIGWIGKNAMLIHPEEGSWFWIGEVLTKFKIATDVPLADRCGTCRRCIEACPTNAILEAKRAVDSRKCISYLTIEHRGAIPKEFQPAIGEWLLGCDICQEVCPWNQQSLKKARAEIGEPPVERIALADITSMENSQFKQLFGKRALARAKLAGLKRNGSIVAANLGPRDGNG